MFIVDYPNRAENITNLNYLLSSQFLPRYASLSEKRIFPSNKSGFHKSLRQNRLRQFWELITESP